MFDFTSRYYTLETATHTTKDGKQIAHKQRRFLPQGNEMQLLFEVTVNESDRLDLITARTLGDPLHFWRVADANNTMNPVELLVEIGRHIRVPVPKA